MPAKESNVKLLKFDACFLDFCFACSAIVVLSFALLNVSLHFERQQPQVQVLGARIDTEKEKQFWINFTISNPTYRDAWIELAKLEQQSGNSAKAKEYIEKAYNLDPNNERVRQLRNAFLGMSF